MAKKLNAAQEAQQVFARIQQGAGNIANQFSSGVQAVVKNLNQPRMVAPIPQQQNLMYRQPIQVPQNFVSQVGRSPIGQAIVGFQKGIEQRTLPRVNLTQYTNNIKAPVPRVAAQFGAQIGQDLINLPQRLLEGGGRIGTQVVRPMQKGKQVNTKQAIGAFASAAEPLFDIATLGSGIAFKQVAKQGVKSIAKQTTKQALLKGALTGAGYGATFGGLRGLSEGEQAEIGNFVQGLAGGAALGGIFGGSTAGAGRLFGAIKAQFPKASNKEIAKKVVEYSRDRGGKFAGLKQDFKTAGLEGRISKPGDKIKITHWMDNVDQQMGVNKDYRIPIGLQIDDVSKKRVTQTIGGAEGKISAKQVTQPVPKTPMQGQTASQGQGGALKGQQGGSYGSSKKSITQVENPTDPYFNVNKLNVDNKAKTQVKRVVEESKPGIEKLVGTKLTNKETVNLANNSASILHRTVSRQETLAWEGKMLKARQLLADQAKDGKVTQEYIDNLFAIKTQGTDIARKLQSLGIGADPQSVTAKQAILEAVLKVNQNTDDILRASKGVDFNDLNQATKFYRQFVAPKKEEWVDLLRYNSMLSSPNTHIINTSSNFQGTGIIAPIEKTVLGGVDFLKSTVTGKPRQYVAGEGIAYAKGYYSNLKNAAIKFSDVMRGKSMIENPDLRNIPLTTSGKGRIAENVLATPMRLLEGMDQFFTTLTKGGVNSSLKYRASKGIKVLNPEIKAQQEAAQRLFRGDSSPEGQGYVLGVLDSGANTVMMLRNSENPIVRTIAKFTLPFVKTPTNILKQGVEYTPLGFSTMAGAGNKTEQFTKALMGTSIAVGVATLLSSDRLTWAEPTNPTAKNKFRDAGLQPYAVKIGNNWVSYAKLHPAIAFNLAFVAALRDAEQNKRLGDEDIETALTALTKWVNFFADQSYVKNIGDFIASTKGDIEGPARYISNYPQQLIPFRALMGWVARLTDPNQRQVDKDGSVLGKQIQQLMTQIPGLSQSVPARLNSLGEPIENQNRVINAFSPARVTTENPQGREIYDQSVEKSRKTKLINDMKTQLKTSSETYGEIDNIIVYKGSDGKDHTIDTSKSPEKPELTGEATLDKQLISKYNSQVTSKISDITEMFKLGKYTQPEAAALITDLQSMKLSTKPKYSSMQPTGNETIDKLLYSKQLGELTTTRNKVLEDLQNEKITNQDAEFLLKEIENRQKAIKVRTAKPKKPKAIKLPKARKVRARVTAYKPLKIKAPKVKLPKYKAFKVRPRKRVKVKVYG